MCEIFPHTFTSQHLTQNVVVTSVPTDNSDIRIVALDKKAVVDFIWGNSPDSGKGVLGSENFAPILML